MRHTILAAAAIGLLALPCAQAQTAATPPAAPSQQDMMRMMHLAARNQLGVLEYCQAQGSVGADSVALQRRLIGMMPPAQVDGLDAAEATGKRGTVSFGGQEVSLPDAAKAQNTTPDAMCKQIASMLQAQAAQLPK